MDKDTFIDPNGDKLTFNVSSLPKWLSFDPDNLKFTGTPTTYATYNVTVGAKDDWNGYT
jgi:hypothetical protein